MKKQYVRPESRLFVINLEENIASSGITGGGDSVTGSAVINFTSESAGCRKYYTGDETAVVQVPVNGTYWEYYDDLHMIAANNFAVYFYCFKQIRP